MFKTHKFTKSIFLTGLFVAFLFFISLNADENKTEIFLKQVQYSPNNLENTVVENEIENDVVTKIVINGHEAEEDELLKIVEETRSQLLKQQKFINFRQKAIKNFVTNILDKQNIKYEDLGLKLVVEKLSPEQIAELSSYFFFVSDIQENTINQETDYLDIDDVKKNTGVSPHGFVTNPWYSDKSATQNIPIGVMLWEMNSRCPQYTTEENIDKSRVTVHSGTNGEREHATKVSYILQKASDHTHIHCMKQEDYSVSPSKFEPAIYISNHSYMRDSTNNYSSYDESLDNMILNTKIASFIAGGNPHEYNPDKRVVSPGKALNAITVGNFNIQNNDFSRLIYGNNEIGNEKPELITNGYFKFSSGNSRGSSLASPYLASGFGANLLSQYAIFRYQPQLLKAFLMTMAQNKTFSESPLNDKEGAGSPHYKNVFSSYWSWWRGSVDYWFSKTDSNSKKYLTKTRYFYKGKKYRVAISWLIDGTYVKNNKQTNIDIDLEVYRGSYSFKSNSDTNPFELVEFTAPVSGTYTIKLTKNRHKKGKLYLGLASTRIDQEN